MRVSCRLLSVRRGIRVPSQLVAAIPRDHRIIGGGHQGILLRDGGYELSFQEQTGACALAWADGSLSLATVACAAPCDRGSLRRPLLTVFCAAPPSEKSTRCAAASRIILPGVQHQEHRCKHSAPLVLVLPVRPLPCRHVRCAPCHRLKHPTYDNNTNNKSHVRSVVGARAVVRGFVLVSQRP
jgi:hypothetical protein